MDIDKVATALITSERALMTPEKNCDTNPILTYENRDNIFIPANSKELQRMKPGPLKSLFLKAYAVEKGNLESQVVYTLMELPAGTRTIRSRAVFDLKWDPITGLLDKAKCRKKYVHATKSARAGFLKVALIRRVCDRLAGLGIGLIADSDFGG
ncbi:gamma-glutamylcyclotransferase [Pycnococcus provasolii]